jgi:transposase InsO family protein
MADSKEPFDEDEALARYLVVAQVRAAVEAGQSKTATVREVAGRTHLGLRSQPRRYGERTVWRWMADWEQLGLEGLAPASLEPRGSSLPPRLLDLLAEQKKDDPEVSIPEVIRIARASGVIAEEEPVDRTTLWRQCRRAGLSTLRRRAKAREVQRPWRFAHRMHCVLADGKFFRAGGARAKRVAIVFLDNASRFVLAVVVGTAESAALALRGLRKVIRRWGLMSCLYVDLGFDAKDLARATAALRIALILGTKSYPEGRGALERFNRTMNEQLLCGWPANPAIDPELLALERRVEHWATEQYNHTPHEGLAGETPSQRFHADSRPLRVPESQAAVDEAFQASFSRRVTNHNCISFESTLWEMPLGHRGDWVTVYRNMITGALEILHDGKRVALKPANLTRNAHSDRGAIPPPADDQNRSRTTAADIAWERDHPPLTDDEGNYRGEP